MPRTCTVCAHPQRDDVDTALLTHDQSERAIASRFGLSRASLQRHQRKCLQLCFQESRELNAMLSAENLVKRLSQLDATTQWGIAQAQKHGDLKMMFLGVVVSRGNIETFVKIASFVDGEQVRALPEPVIDPSLSAEDMRTVLRTLIESGAAMMPGEPSVEGTAEELTIEADEQEEQRVQDHPAAS